MGFIRKKIRKILSKIMPKIAIVRGRHLNKYEMQFYEPLASKYDLMGFGSISSYHTNFNCPVAKLLSPIDILEVTSHLHIPQHLVLGILNRLFIDAQYLYGLEEKLKGYDIAHAADTFYHFTHQCIVAKRKGYVKKVIATVYENIPFNNEGIWGRKEFKKDALGEVDHFIAISERSKAALILEGCPEEKISVVTQAIDTKRFKPKKKIEKDKINILFSGRLEWYKGVYEIINAAALILKESEISKYNPRFILVGEGSEKSKLLELEERLGIKQFIDHRNVAYENMPQIYQNADIFIAPSNITSHWQEQFSTVLLEAQASGLPIVTTNTGGIPENVGEAAITVGAGDFYGLAKALKNLILDKDLRSKYGKKARERAVKHFDIKIISDKIDKIYESLL